MAHQAPYATRMISNPDDEAVPGLPDTVDDRLVFALVVAGIGRELAIVCQPFLLARGWSIAE